MPEGHNNSSGTNAGTERHRCAVRGCGRRLGQEPPILPGLGPGTCVLGVMESYGEKGNVSTCRLSWGTKRGGHSLQEK